MVTPQTEEKVPIAKFNAALSKLERIHELRRLCHIFRIESNYKGWFECLLGIRSELWQFMNNEERESSQESMSKLSQIFNQTFNTIKEEDPNPYTVPLYTELDNIERILFDIEHKYGLSMPKKDMASFLDSD